MAATEERWRAHVMAWAKSGLTCKAYAARARVNAGTLAVEVEAGRGGDAGVVRRGDLGSPLVCSACC